MASDPYLCEIQIFAFNFAPRGWLQCNGQLLPIAANAALFSLLGTTYGGNGTTNFAIPNYQGRVPVHIGNGIIQGQIGGEESHTLNISEMPGHNHTVKASGANTSQPTPAGNLWAKGASFPGFSNATNNNMHPGSIGLTGGNQPHENRMPFLVLNICIAVVGIFPSRN